MNGAVADWSEEKTNENQKIPGSAPGLMTFLVGGRGRETDYVSEFESRLHFYLFLVFQLHLFFCGTSLPLATSQY